MPCRLKTSLVFGRNLDILGVLDILDELDVLDTLDCHAGWFHLSPFIFLLSPFSSLIYGS